MKLKPIDANELMEWLKSKIRECVVLNAHAEAATTEEIIRYVKHMPAVDAVPMVCAEWIEEPEHEGHYHCSNCGVVWGVSAMAMKHCPNCTAKMMNSPMWEVEDEAATEMEEYCERYEPTYNPEDGSM